MTSSDAPERLAALLKQVRPTEGITIKQMILITHGSGGVLLGKALHEGHLKFDRTVRWLGLNVPQQKPHVLELLDKDNCNKDFEDLVEDIADEADSDLKMSCKKMEKTGWAIHDVEEFYTYELSAGLCGAVASHKTKEQREFLNFLETEETKGLALKTLTDGINRIDHCLTLSQDGLVLTKFHVLSINYWDSQMVNADKIKKGGVRHWLYVTATKALEKLVNGEDPDLKNSFTTELERLYEEAEVRRAEELRAAEEEAQYPNYKWY